MIRILSKSPDAASPRMLIISAGLHAILLCAIILFSYSMARWPVPREEIISRVKLVEAHSGPAIVEQVQSAPINAPAILPRETVDPQVNTKDSSQSLRQTIEPTTMSPAQNQAISLRTRKAAKHVEKPKKPESKEPDVPASKKKEDPQEYLKKQLASIQEKVKNSKSDASAPVVAPTNARDAGATGSKDGGKEAEEELRRWLEDVRNRINSRWSVFGDHRQVSRPTEIGVTIDDNGRLRDAAVNQSSGSQVFDQSALRAVFQADPFPPIRPGVREEIRKAGGLALRFAPGGMQ